MENLQDLSKKMRGEAKKILARWTAEGFVFYPMDIRKFIQDADPMTHINTSYLFLKAVKTDMTGEFFLTGYNMLSSDDNLIVRFAGRTGCLSDSTSIKIFENSKLIDSKLKDVYKKYKNREFEILAFNFLHDKTEKDNAIITDSGIKEVFELKLSDGKKVIASNDHKFFVYNGHEILEKRLKDLNINDIIVII